MDVPVAFGLLGVTLLATALAAGVIVRAPISFPIIFLGIGLAIGPGALGLAQLRADAPLLGVLASLTLSLVLFLDALDLELAGKRRELVAPLLALGPVTVIVAAGVALAAIAIFHFPPATGLLLGAVLGSTDPAVMRDVLRDNRLPMAVRRVLRIEAGANDVVVLPVVLILISISTARPGTNWFVFLVELLLVGPLLGFFIGGIASWLMARVNRRLGVGREFQSLYGVGIVLAAYAAGSLAGASGFLAVFAAGVGVRVFDQELCDCFLEFGAAAAEMTMLLAFVLFGIVLSALLPKAPLLAGLALGLLTVLVLRPAVAFLVLALEPARLSWRARAFIGWFGPRGLTSLLLALLVVEAGVSGSETFLAVVGSVVLVSVVLHGITASPVSAAYAGLVARRTLAEERLGSSEDLLRRPAEDVPRVSVEELATELAGPNPPAVLDVRTRSEFDRDPRRIPSSVRVLPDEVTRWAEATSPGRVVLYCT